MSVLQDRAWAIWLTVTAGSFAVLEIAAFRGHLPTLSRTLARWMGVREPGWWGQVSPPLFLAFWAWLTVHVLQYRPPDN